jgi:hypothetical protein
MGSNMTQTLSWYIPEQVLTLVLDGQPTTQELETVNQEIIDILDASPNKISIVIDVNNLNVTYQTTEKLKTTQTYMNHLQLSLALIITANKLNRLITLMAFSTARTKIVQCANIQCADTNLIQRGFMQEPET